MFYNILIDYSCYYRPYYSIFPKKKNSACKQKKYFCVYDRVEQLFRNK